jgi:hypothetical protein
LHRLGGDHLGLEQFQPGAQGDLEGFLFARRLRRAGRDLCRAPGRAQRGCRGAQGQRDAFRARLHGRVRDRISVGLYLALGTPAEIAKKVPAAIGEANTFRVIFFILTFFSIGVLSNFKTLWQEGFGKLAAVYVLSLFGFVIWVGLLIFWIFFGGVTPPLAS